jgi:hypothetical protein
VARKVYYQPCLGVLKAGSRRALAKGLRIDFEDQGRKGWPEWFTRILAKSLSEAA